MGLLFSCVQEFVRAIQPLIPWLSLTCQDDEANAIAIYSVKLSRLGLDASKIEHHISAMRAQQSQRAGDAWLQPADV